MMFRFRRPPRRALASPRAGSWFLAALLAAVVAALIPPASLAADFTPDQRKAIESKAALAARKQGKYDAFHRAMMTLKGQINDTAVYKTAESVGVDVDRLKRDMAAPEIARALKANTELADALDIRGTPGFIVGNEIVPGAIDLARLKPLIATARKK